MSPCPSSVLRHLLWCASGRQNLCDLGMMTLAGGMISDGTYRYHLGART